MMSADVDICYCDHSYVSQGTIVGERENAHMPEGDILTEYIRGSVLIPTGSYIVKRDLLKRYEILYTEGCISGEDTEFRIKMLSVGKAAAIPESLHRVVIRGRSASRSFNLANFDSAVGAYRRSVLYIKENVSDKKLASSNERAVTENGIPLRIATSMCAASYLGHSGEAIRYAFCKGYYKDILKYRPNFSKSDMVFFYNLFIGHLGPVGRIIGEIRQGHTASP